MYCYRLWTSRLCLVLSRNFCDDFLSLFYSLQCFLLFLLSVMAASYRFRFNDHPFTPPPEAPVFEPTKEEFEVPLRYIERIRPIAERYGICKIKPPQEWQPPFAVDIKKFRFTPRVQKINELEARTRIKLNFIERISRFWQLQGTNLKLPVVSGRILDLYLLFNLVEEKGGFYSVNADEGWVKIATQMGLSPRYHSVLKAHYDKILFPYSVFSQRMSPDLNPKDFLVVNEDEEDIVLRYAGEEVKKNIEKARRLSVEKGETAMSSYLSDKKCNVVTVEQYTSEQRKKTKDDSDPLSKYYCLNCEGGDEEESMLLCDGCDDSYHTFCLLPPLSEIPKGDWCCPNCIAKDFSLPVEPYGFEQGHKSYTLEEFGEAAEKFKMEYFKSNDIPNEVVEREFWTILSRLDSNVTVEYGADLHTVEHGSGFPSLKTVNMSRDPEAPKYLASPWNLNNLPVLPSSVLGFIKADISGMKVPWMYVGMCFSTFCWHNEDHWSYSINYLHWGESKTWYGVPGGHADNFEKVMKNAAPELFNAYPNLLHQLTTILNPNVLMDEGVPVYRTDQQAGEFVITFPRAYHAGFNQGYNFAEAVNFAPLDWVPIGRESIAYYSRMKRENVFSHDELVCGIAAKVDEIDPLTALVIYEEMMILLKTEKKFREELYHWGVRQSEQFSFENYPDDLRQCDFCKTTCYVSCVACKCKTTPRKIACYRHYREVCPCPPTNHILRFKWKLIYLVCVADKLRSKCSACDTWLKFIKEKSMESE